MNNLKKAIIALMVILATAASAQAKIIGFGIKAGMNVNKLSLNKDIANASNSVGWTAGVMADVTVPILGFGVDAGVMYARMNNTSDVTYTKGDADNNLYGKNFLEIPINIKYKFTLPVVGSVLKPYLFTGPNFAFNLDKKAMNTLLNLESSKFQMAWNVGLGFEFFSHLQIGASYGFGCNNVVKVIDASKVADSYTKAKNNYWTVTAAYIF